MKPTITITRTALFALTFLVGFPTLVSAQTGTPTQAGPTAPKTKKVEKAEKLLAKKPKEPIQTASKLPTPPESVPEKRPQPGDPAPADAIYTGVIIDCSGMGLTSTPSPKLYDEEGVEVYGTISVSDEYLFDQGIVAYPRSMEAAVSHARIGGKPMIIKALRLDKETHSEPVISQADAKRLREANAKDHFLERCAVVFVIAQN